MFFFEQAAWSRKNKCCGELKKLLMLWWRKNKLLVKAEISSSIQIEFWWLVIKELEEVNFSISRQALLYFRCQSFCSLLISRGKTGFRAELWKLSLKDFFCFDHDANTKPKKVGSIFKSWCRKLLIQNESCCDWLSLLNLWLEIWFLFIFCFLCFATAKI